MTSGILLIVVGVVWLLRNFGILPHEFWRIILPWWPLVIVALGLKAIFMPRRSTSIVTIVLVLILLGAGYMFLFPAQEVLERPWATAVVPIPAGVTMPRVSPLVGLNADIRASHFTLRAGDPATPNLAQTRWRGLPVRQTLSDWGAQHEVIELSHLHQRGRMLNLGNLRSDVVTELNPEQTFALEIRASAAAVELDLRGLALTGLNFRLNAGQATLRIPEYPKDIEVFVEANAGDIRIVIPANVAARIRIETEAAMVVVDERRFLRQGAFYVSPDYDQAHYRIELAVDLAAGRLRIE